MRLFVSPDRRRRAWGLSVLVACACSPDNVRPSNLDPSDAAASEAPPAPKPNRPTPKPTVSPDSGLSETSDAGDVILRGEGHLPPPFEDVTVTRPDAAAPPPPECDAGFKWGVGTAPPGLEGVVAESIFDVTSDGDHWLVSIAADGGEAQLVLFDLPGDGKVIRLPNTYALTHGASLSVDGRTLVVARADGRGFGAATRGGTADAFGEFSAAMFNTLNQIADQTMASYSWPVLNAASSRLYYTRIGAGSDVLQARRQSEQFEVGVLLNPDVLQGGPSSKLLSAISNDELTLLFWDEALQRTTAAWRHTLGLPFLETTAVTTESDQQVMDAHLAEGCRTLFYRSASGALLSAKLKGVEK